MTNESNYSVTFYDDRDFDPGHGQNALSITVKESGQAVVVRLDRDFDATTDTRGQYEHRLEKNEGGFFDFRWVAGPNSRVDNVSSVRFDYKLPRTPYQHLHHRAQPAGGPL